MTMQEELVKKEALELAYDQACKALGKYPKLPNGLTPDSVRADPVWKADKKAVEVAFANLRAFNLIFIRKHGRQYQIYMRQKRGVA